MEGYGIQEMGASDVQGLFSCGIGHVESWRHVWSRRRRGLFDSYEIISDTRASPVSANEAGAFDLSAVGESCSYIVVISVDFNQALATLYPIYIQPFIISQEVADPSGNTCILRSGSPLRSH